MPTKYSHQLDSKIVRIPTDVKNALDKAKPPGIEHWKFISDVIMLGLAARERMKSNKDMEGITNYDIVGQLSENFAELLRKK